MSAQLYAACDAKLERVASHILWLFREAKHATGPAQTPLATALQEAYMDVARCRRELKYEHLGLRDSWL